MISRWVRIGAQGESVNSFILPCPLMRPQAQTSSERCSRSLVQASESTNVMVAKVTGKGLGRVTSP
jgi:hypothetical protein